MSVEERYKQKNLNLQERLKKEIENCQSGIGEKSVDQLSKMLDELKIIYNEKGKQLSFPRFIVDSWDYTDELGIDLLDLVEIYKRWK